MIKTTQFTAFILTFLHLLLLSLSLLLLLAPFLLLSLSFVIVLIILFHYHYSRRCILSLFTHRNSCVNDLIHTQHVSCSKRMLYEEHV